MLEVHDLKKHFRSIPAVDGVSFTAPAGTVTGCLGPNGSGKSTTVKIIVGLIERSDGDVLYQGRSVFADISRFQQKIGYVPEEPYLYSYLSGYEYLELVGLLRLVPAERLRARIERLLRLFDLWGDRLSALSSYSKGMRQKVLLAAALLNDPEVVILDEPFSGLDVNSALAVRGLIRSLAEAGKVVLLSSHEMDTVEKVCSRVVILYQGRVVASDSVEHLRELMSLPTLEQIFTQLALKTDPEVAARELLEATRL
jgi:ABC-2 type transport system ATP-binding protein